MESQRESPQRALMKFELPAERYVLSVVLGIDALKNYAADRLIRHCHGQYEVHFQWSPREPDRGSFRIIPPGVWHTGRLQDPNGELQLTSFVFTVRQRLRGEAYNSACGTTLESFLRLTEETTVTDAFGGSGLIHAIRSELQMQETACFDRIYALIHLLMVELARHLPCYEQQPRSTLAHGWEEFLPERIEQFLGQNYSDPACNRERMAQHLSVSERQLGRILQQIYGKSFRQLLLERRMEFAEAWRVSDGLSADETAQRVGYASVQGFRNAYEKYHGKQYQKFSCQK